MARHTTIIAPHWLIFLLLAACVATAQDRQGLEERLQADYVGKYWVIRGFYEGEDLVFDSGGKLLKGEPAQAWTLAGVEVTSLKLHEADLEIAGKRVAYAYDVTNERFTHKYRVGPPKDEIETVKITLQTPFSVDEASLRQALERVLIPDGHDLSSEVPYYWCGFLEKQADAPIRAATTLPDVRATKPPPLSSGLTFANGSPVYNGGPVYSVGKGVTAPRPISTPDPQYNEPARRAKFQGDTVLFMIIDKAGRPVGIRVVRPAGFGLDDQAVATVRHWKFKPGERNGEPVAVMTNVNINFRLY